MLSADEIKNLVTVQDVLSKMYGLEVRARMACPIHGGTNNNFSVKDDSFFCFVCGKGGDIFNLVQELSNTDFQGARALICEAFGLDVGKKSKKQKQELRIKIKRHREQQEARRVLRKLRQYQQDRICQLLRSIRTIDGDSYLEKHLEGLLRKFDERACFWIVHDIHAHLKAIWGRYLADLEERKLKEYKP